MHLSSLCNFVSVVVYSYECFMILINYWVNTYVGWAFQSQDQRFKMFCDYFNFYLFIYLVQTHFYFFMYRKLISVVFLGVLYSFFYSSFLIFVSYYPGWWSGVGACTRVIPQWPWWQAGTYPSPHHHNPSDLR